MSPSAPRLRTSPRWSPPSRPTAEPPWPCASSWPPAPSPAPGTYDAAISAWFARQLGDAAPARKAIGGTLRQTLRYGENPHQTASFYASGDARPGVTTARQLQGKELSYNNIADTDAAFELVAEFSEPACVIVKHANPCGVATGADLGEAYARALACDPVSAFGGIIAVNRKLDARRGHRHGRAVRRGGHRAGRRRRGRGRVRRQEEPAPAAHRRPAPTR